MTDRKLDLDDIQGNILAGFNTDVQALIALTAPEQQSLPQAAKWLADQAASVTVVSDVRAQRDSMKSGKPDASLTWLFVAVGQRLLNVTQPDVLIRDDAFNGGMLKRAPSILGDKTDPSKWIVGGTVAPVDILLLIAANNENAVTDRADNLGTQAAKVGLQVTYREIARRLDKDIEHFGFRDGISQPAVIGYDLDGVLGPGNFVFGYPKNGGSKPFWPVLDQRGITDGGSLLVFRRLVQNVRAFQEFCNQEVTRLSSQWPGLTEELLAAHLVGRWPSGSPVKVGQVQDPVEVPTDNSFDFQDDSSGRSCPFGAHIRKVNPRSGPKDVVDVPRILRRGIPFGTSFALAPDDDNRGLAFLAFQSSIKSQFEFLTQHWMNSPLNPGPGNDLFVGRAEGVRTMYIAGPNGKLEVSAREEFWIVPTGGAYLFAPSRSGLAKFGTPSAPTTLLKAKMLWARTSDAITASFFANRE
jgi:Dyp-type peroxidase family